MNSYLTRRNFLSLSAKGVGAAVISYGLAGCNAEDISQHLTFSHGVASGDPLSDAFILWTRVSPQLNEKDIDLTSPELLEALIDTEIPVSWEIALDDAFTNLVTTGFTYTNISRDFTVKVDAINLQSGTNYYYRFKAGQTYSPVGQARTLPQGSVESVKLAIMSCANYPTGYFNVYALAAEQNDLDAVIHLGDYIYEYGQGGYASDNAQELNREVLPAGELLTLEDYRTRYAQYRTDSNLQKLHSKVAFIMVWDDHEVANDTWREGAENHSDDEGDFDERKEAALQAYFEWLPIRTYTQTNAPDNTQEGYQEEIYRSFNFGDLLDLHMLDTRLLGRDKQLSYLDYISLRGFDSARFEADINDPNRTMLGAQQLAWLQENIANAKGQWQLLGQQVLMGAMYLPGSVATGQWTLAQFSQYANIATLAQRAQAGDPKLTSAELDILSSSQDQLTPKVLSLLQLPNLPYNLDAWDGYASEREKIYQSAKEAGRQLIVIAGDTHNAWANNLKDNKGNAIGVEFATSSVSSPGLESYLNIPAEAMAATESAIVGLVPNLQYANLRNRGYLELTIYPDSVESQWRFVDTILSQDYAELIERDKQLKVNAYSATIEPV